MAAPALLTAQEYFAIDDASDVKHELVDGVLWAMAGGTVIHTLLATRITGILGSRLQGKDCEPYNSDLRVALTFRSYAYPDATVICGEPEIAEEDSNTVVNPKVVFEVLSPTTERYDRGIKARRYRELPSLTTLVFVASEEPVVEVQERGPDGKWTLQIYEGVEAVVPLPAIDAELPLAELYKGVAFA